MAKIAIYDRFYQSEEHRAADVVGQALEGSAHEVIGTTANLREAVRQLIGFAGLDVTERPDMVIMGGMLEGESDYRTHPLTVTEPCPVRRSTWLGGVKEEIGERITFLLPQFEPDGTTYYFPDVTTIGKVHQDPPEELSRQWNAGFSGIAARVLSRIVETYLPESDRIGVSSNPMFDAVLSQEAVNRQSRDAAQQLREYIL